MVRLPSGDLEHVLAFVAELYDHDGPGAFSRAHLDRMKELVPCDLLSFNDIDFARQKLAGVNCSAQEKESEDAPPPEFFAACWSSPIAVFRRRIGEQRPFKVSDMFTRRQRQRWAHGQIGYFREAGVKDAMRIDFGPSRTRVGRLLFDRCGADFTERDQAVAALLRPHFAAAYRNAAKRRLLDAALAATEADAAAVLTAHGETECVSPVGNELLERWFGDSSRLPEPLAAWLSSSPCEPFVCERDGRRLVVETAGRPGVLLLREEPTVDRRLTPREREVIRLVAHGKANKEVARALWVTPATVKKHLEHIYEKLGVTNRTAAVAKLALPQPRAPR